MPRALRNRTLTCDRQEIAHLADELLHLYGPADAVSLKDQIIQQDFSSIAQWLPTAFVDLLILDPPYNLSKNYHGNRFKAQSTEAYAAWFEAQFLRMLPLLKPEASVYLCSDWRTSALVFPILNKHLHVRNRITWEREKGRGSKTNWKNNTEDIWFATCSEQYTFNVDAVKIKRQVRAPYRDDDGRPKDWHETPNGDYRLTHPSNFWSDITVPFWSMPENTDHPTQKPEKLIAKLILASSNPKDTVLDPFLGSGTTAVVAYKLNRHFLGIEINQQYSCWALKRLNMAAHNPSIQGYTDGVFWERNSLSEQTKSQSSNPKQEQLL